MARKAQQAETRSIENPLVPVSAANFLEFFGVGGGSGSAAGVAVTVDNALGVPAVWSAVSFLSGTLASLPLHVYRRKGEGRERVRGALATLLSDAVNDEMSSFDWRKYAFGQFFTSGRSVSFVERNAAQRVMNIWPLETKSVTVKRGAAGREYHYRDGSAVKVYRADEVIDLVYMPKPDLCGHYSPIRQNRDVIGMAIALTQYASKFFQNGGVPPFAVTGNFQSTAAMKRAADDLAESVRKAAREQRQALVMPSGMEIKPIGADPEKTQLILAHRFIIEQIARIWGLPPVFLQDLTHGSFSNTEQQDLHFVKHCLLLLAKQFEQELNLKLFGRTSTVQFVELNVDGLLRGDFKTRMEGYASAIQHGVMMPNEARRRENQADAPGGDRLFVQGAMVPIDKAGQAQTAPAPAPQPTTPPPAADDDEGDATDV
jgi:HK97 family phage portal protein